MLTDTIAAMGDFAEALWHFGQLGVGGVRRPLNDALVILWTTPADKHVVRPLKALAAERVFYVDLQDVPDEALKTLRDFLSTQVLGDKYAAQFHSFSTPLLPLGTEPSTLIEQAVEQLRANLPAAARKAARCAEWWAHRRPTKTAASAKRIAVAGHQFHWDRDGDEAKGQLPLFTSVLYLTRTSGPAAPLVVLNTSLRSAGGLEDVAWIIPAAEGRVAYVHGEMLHGVLPSAGSMENTPVARLSLNIAWWPWECRVAEKTLSAIPSVNTRWAEVLASAAPPTFWTPEPVVGIFCGEDHCGRHEHQEL